MYLNDFKFNDDFCFRYLCLSGLSVIPYRFTASSVEGIIRDTVFTVIIHNTDYRQSKYVHIGA